MGEGRRWWRLGQLMLAHEPATTPNAHPTELLVDHSCTPLDGDQVLEFFKTPLINLTYRWG